MHLTIVSDLSMEQFLKKAEGQTLFTVLGDSVDYPEGLVNDFKKEPGKVTVKIKEMSIDQLQLEEFTKYMQGGECDHCPGHFDTLTKYDESYVCTECLHDIVNFAMGIHVK